MRLAEILDLAGATRDQLGRRLRQRWHEWAETQPDAAGHPSWTAPWDELPERFREVDRQMAADLFRAGWDAREQAMTPRPCHCLCAAAHPQQPGICDALNALVEQHIQLRTLTVAVRVCWPCAQAAGEYQAARANGRGQEGPHG